MVLDELAFFYFRVFDHVCVHKMCQTCSNIMKLNVILTDGADVTDISQNLEQLCIFHTICSQSKFRNQLGNTFGLMVSGHIWVMEMCGVIFCFVSRYWWCQF